MTSRPSSRVRFDEESIRSAAAERAASRGKPAPVDSSKFFTRDGVKDAAEPLQKTAGFEQGSDPILEAKVSEDQNGGDDNYWLNLATADTGDDEDDGRDEDYALPVAQEAGVDDGLDDEAYLERFNQRWGTPKTDDGRGEGEGEGEEPRSSSETKAIDQDMGFTAEGEERRDLDEESVGSLESLVEEAMSGSGDFKRLSTPPTPSSKPSTPSSSRETHSFAPLQDSQPEEKEGGADPNKLSDARGDSEDNSASVAAEVKGNVPTEEPTQKDGQEQQASIRRDVEEEKDAEKAHVTTHGTGEGSDEQAVAAQDHPEPTLPEPQPPQAPQEQDQEPKQAEPDDVDELMAVIDAPRGEFEELVHDMVGGGASDHHEQGHRHGPERALICWRCRSEVARENLFCVTCGAKARKRGWDSSVAATPSSSISGVTIGHGDGGASISTVGSASLSSSQLTSPRTGNKAGAAEKKSASPKKQATSAAPPPKPVYEASGIKGKRSGGKSADDDGAGTAEDGSVQTELQLLPAKLVHALNSLRAHIANPEVAAKRRLELDRREQHVLDLEIQHSLRLEDVYMNVSTTEHMGFNPDKVRPNPGIVFAEPSEATKELLASANASAGGSTVDIAAGHSLLSSSISSAQSETDTGATAGSAAIGGGTHGVIGAGAVTSGAFLPGPGLLGGLGLGEEGMSQSQVEGYPALPSGMSDSVAASASSARQPSVSTSVYDQIDTSGEIHYRSNMNDPLGNYAHLVNPAGHAAAAAASSTSVGSSSASGKYTSVTGTGSGSIYSHENRPVGLAHIQAEYAEIDKTLPRVAYSSTKQHQSIPMPSYVRQPKQKIAWKKDRLETLALQKEFQVVHTKGVTREREFKVALKPAGTVVVAEEWKPWLPTDRPYLGDKQSDKEASKTVYPTKTYSYVTSYLDEVPSIMEYFDSWFARERELHLPGAEYGGIKYRALEGSTATTDNYHYLQYLKSMKREERLRRRRAEESVSRLYDQAVERERDTREQRQQQQQKKKKEEEEDEVTASGSFFWGGAPTLHEEDEEEISRHLEQEQEQEQKQEQGQEQGQGEGKGEMERVAGGAQDYTDGGAKAFWWGPLKAKGRFLLPHNYHLPQDQDQADPDASAPANDGASVAESSTTSVDGSASVSSSRKERRLAKEQLRAATKAYENSAEMAYAKITGDAGSLPPHPASPGPGPGPRSTRRPLTGFDKHDLESQFDDSSMSSADAGSYVVRNPYETFGSSGSGYGAPQLLDPAYMRKTATTDAKTYYSRPGTSSRNDTVGDLTVRGTTPTLHSARSQREIGSAQRQRRMEMEVMFQAFAAQDEENPGAFLPPDDPHGFSERYGNIDKYYGGTMDDDTESEGEEEREAREKKERQEIEAEMERIRAKEKKREDKIALMRKHGLLGSDSEPSSSDESDSTVEVDTPPTSPRLLEPIARSTMHRERLQEKAKPMLWTGVIQPDGPAGFFDDVAKGLERPLTPEPTSDDEDAAFEAELLAMQASEKKDQGKGGDKDEVTNAGAGAGAGDGDADGYQADKESAPPPTIFSFPSLPPQRADGSSAEGEGEVSRPSTTKSKASSADEEAVRQEEKRAKEEEESEEIVPDKVIAQRKAQRKAYLARMRKKIKFDAIFDVKGGNKEQLEPIFRQNPDKEDRHKENLAVKSLMPGEKGHAVMSRLYKRSTQALKHCVEKPNALNLTHDPISDDRDAPWPLAHSLLRRYSEMVEAIDEALIRAPINDATARKEFVAYQNVLAKRRTEAAAKVSDALKQATDCQKRYDKKHDELIERLQAAPEPKKPKIREFISKVKETYSSELLALGEQVVAQQQDEEKDVSQCQQLEETCVRVLSHWRPIHARLFEEAKLVKFRLEALIRIISARVIQRTARRRLLMFYRGTPEELEDDMLKDLERRMLAKKKKVYKMRPW